MPKPFQTSALHAVRVVRVVHAVRVAAATSVLAVALFALIHVARVQGHPPALADAAAPRLPCVSYAPFRRSGATPFDASLVVAPAHIEADLRLLSRVTGCVRTYGVDQGLDAVPAIARRLGLRVVLGAWLGRDAAANTAQLDRALALAREHADVVDLLMVGNEVLLRRELAPDQLAALLARAKRESAVPVSYADVWEFWLRHGAVLRTHIDVVSVHVLPYWEDEPVAVEHAVAHVNATVARVLQVFAPLPVFLAETGWPAEGRQRGPARPGKLEQTRFVREWVTSLPGGTDPRWRGNLIEGFDQPWKRALEGAMGGHWGVFLADGRQRVELVGPVSPSLAGALLGPLLMLGGALGGALVAAACFFARERRPAPPQRPWEHVMPPTTFRAELAALAPVAVGALVGALTAPLAMLQWQMLQVWSRSPAERWLHGSVAVAAFVCTGFAALRLMRRLATPGSARFEPRRGVVDAFRARGAGAAERGVTAGSEFGGVAAGPERGVAAEAARLFAAAQAALLFAVACIALGLVFDPRYRPLVWPMLVPPTVLLFALAVLGDRLARGAREERLLAAVGAAAAGWVVWQEGMANTEAWFAAGTWLLLAAATAWPHRAAPLGGPGRTPTSAPSSSARAPSSVE